MPAVMCVGCYGSRTAPPTTLAEANSTWTVTDPHFGIDYCVKYMFGSRKGQCEKITYDILQLQTRRRSTSSRSRATLTWIISTRAKDSSFPRFVFDSIADVLSKTDIATMITTVKRATLTGITGNTTKSLIARLQQLQELQRLPRVVQSRTSRLEMASELHLRRSRGP